MCSFLQVNLKVLPLTFALASLELVQVYICVLMEMEKVFKSLNHHQKREGEGGREEKGDGEGCMLKTKLRNHKEP